MASRTRTLAAAVGALFALWVAWGAYVDRVTEQVPYETTERLDGVEVRRYPEAVLAETTAPDRGTAFRRLFRYITGANEASEEVAMTAPVATRDEAAAAAAPARTGGEEVAMTAPVRTVAAEDAVTMAFYLPAGKTLETAPRPTDGEVRLVAEPPRTVAVYRFSWYATDGRVERARRRLLDELAASGIEPRGEPMVLQYDDPWTPPFMRTNEVAVPVSKRA